MKSESKVRDTRADHDTLGDHGELSRSNPTTPQIDLSVSGSRYIERILIHECVGELRGTSVSILRYGQEVV
jgi:hypothetical protein